MPEDFEQMFAYALGHIAHQPEGWLQMKNPAPVQDRLRKAAVAIVMGYQEVKILRSYPAVHLHSRQRLPCKRACRLAAHYEPLFRERHHVPSRRKYTDKFLHPPEILRHRWKVERSTHRHVRDLHCLCPVDLHPPPIVGP